MPYMINRVGWGSSKDITVNEFVAGYIDYRECGNEYEQLKMLIADFESLGYRVSNNAERDRIEAAFTEYVRKIRNKYAEV